VCKAEIEESKMNDHLDQCLLSPPPEIASKAASSNPFVDEEDSGPCPVCGKEVFIQEMNDHLDNCVAANQ
jgi:hypothetical protein